MNNASKCDHPFHTKPSIFLRSRYMASNSQIINGHFIISIFHAILFSVIYLCGYSLNFLNGNINIHLAVSLNGITKKTQMHFTCTYCKCLHIEAKS